LIIDTFAAVDGWLAAVANGDDVFVVQHLPEHRVRVLVVANLQLSPSVVYILPHLTVTYKVELLKQGKAHGKNHIVFLWSCALSFRDVNIGSFCKPDFGCWKTVSNRFSVLLTFLEIWISSLVKSCSMQFLCLPYLTVWW